MKRLSAGQFLISLLNSREQSAVVQFGGARLLTSRLRGRSPHRKGKIYQHRTVEQLALLRRSGRTHQPNKKPGGLFTVRLALILFLHLEED